VHDLKSSRLGAIPTVGGLLTRLAYERVKTAGIAPEPILKTAGLTKQQIEDVDARLSTQSQIKFVNLAASALHDEFLGFNLGRQLDDLRKFGLLYYIAASSDTLGESLRRTARYVSITNESYSVKYFEDKNIRVVHEFVGIARQLATHQIESGFVALIRFCRQLTSYRVEPSRVRLIHNRRADDSPEFAGFFGCDVEFGADLDEVILSRSIANMPVVSADPYLNKLLIAIGEEVLSRRPAKQSPFRAVVENAIVPLLPHGNVRETEIASQCGLSRRTFVRRLASANLTFSEVLDDLRRDLAARYLADHSLSISQIAWLIGYHEVGALTNAFKRWTGKTPREARTELQRVAS
jgi:AraC-like DNA-binding protein